MALDMEKIRGSTEADGRQRIHYFHSIGSTSEWLLEQSGEVDVHGHVCLTDEQTAGRGRSGKSWAVTPLQNVEMSMAYRFGLPVRELSPLSLVTGIAVVDALDSLGVQRLSLKWPNDVYMDGAKLAGILIQTRAGPPGQTLAVAGIGINVLLSPKLRAQIGQPVAELAGAGLGPDRREEVIIRILDQLCVAYAAFMDLGWAQFSPRWQQLDYFQGRSVCLLQGESKVEGKYLGVNPDGALQIRLADGRIRDFYAGEASLRSADPGSGQVTA